MLSAKPYQFWFVTGSQHLYGPETLRRCADHSRIIAEALDRDAAIPVEVVFKPVVTTPEEIRSLCPAANADESCAGIITWMHTFSPAKMWIAGLPRSASRCCICTRSSTATFRGTPSTWIS